MIHAQERNMLCKQAKLGQTGTKQGRGEIRTVIGFEPRTKIQKERVFKILKK